MPLQEAHSHSLPPLPKDPEQSVERWYVIYTKSRQEKAVELALNSRGIKAYCPKMLQVRQWTDRKKKVEVPLFSSYCFVRISLKNKNDVFSVQGIVRYVYWQGKPAYAHDHEIEQIQHWLNDQERDFAVADFSENDRIKIKSGALINQEGLLVQKAGNQVILWLDKLGMKVITTLKETLIERVAI